MESTAGFIASKQLLWTFSIKGRQNWTFQYLSTGKISKGWNEGDLVCAFNNLYYQAI